MAILSKQLFEEKHMGNLQCTHLHGTIDESCKNYIWKCNRTAFIGCFKFFLPICILQFIWNYKNMKGPIYKEFLRMLIRRSLSAFLFESSVLSSMCLISHSMGKIGYYLAISSPGLFGASSLIETQKEREVNSLLSLNLVVESLFNAVKHYNIFGLTAPTLPALTILFMLNNALLMYLFSNKDKDKKSLFFWIYTPQINKQNDSQCYHENDCFKYCLEGMKKYFWIGFSCDVVRKIISKIMVLVKKPYLLVKLLSSKSSIRTGLFLGSYVTVHRLISCYLLRKKNLTVSYHPLVAGFFSGLSFGILPNIQVLCLAISLNLKFLYSKVEDKFVQLKKLPMLLALYMFCQGLLIYERLFAPEMCPDYYKQILSTTSSGMIDIIANRIQKL